MQSCDTDRIAVQLSEHLRKSVQKLESHLRTFNAMLRFQLSRDDMFVMKITHISAMQLCCEEMVCRTARSHVFIAVGLHLPATGICG